MISGATRGAGGPALGRHLARTTAEEHVFDLEARGLIATDIRGRISELTRLASHARTRTPLYHVHADPSADRTWTEDERAAWWSAFETEFGLENRPFAAVQHRKKGRVHEHRVYLRIQPDGTAIRLDHDYARRERLARLFELARGEPLVPGAHSRAVIARLDGEGRTAEATILREAGLAAVDRPRAPLTPDERHQQARTGIDVGELQAAALAAWKSSDDGCAFQAALAERGLRLAQGEKTMQLLDATGAMHDLRRTLSAAAKTAGDGAIRASDIRNRLTKLVLPTIAQTHVAAAIPSTDDISPQADGDASHDAIRQTDAEGRPIPAGTALEHQTDPRGADGDGGARDPAGDRSQGNERGAVCASADGDDDGRPSAAADPAGATGGGGAGRAQPDPDAAGDDRRGSGSDRGAARGARARDRIATRRLARHAGAREERLDELIEVLRDPATALARAMECLRAEGLRIQHILAAEPFPDGRDLDSDIIAAKRLRALDGEHGRLVAVAEGAAQKAKEAKAALTIWDRWLPWSTRSHRGSVDASARSNSAALTLLRFREELGERRRSICQEVTEIVRQRTRERRVWLKRPDIREAMAVRRRIEDQLEAIRRGDLEVAVCLLPKASANSFFNNPRGKLFP